ncbi:GNAT family N-acetyltransferase [Plectonema cf. radiosum LEGE 06105]|uniref:GNAT family N-acetyltransferase n=1 Tax=Plectonema cf. radiosum LEGE 06105 TaxID=945769 RepID=A0A8J7F9P6_9CYAN|nr:GNAT family N-acetyltransferase [Plectonema radiosum]MBE9217187.1 GNAT family N-acetyltransferase [Plectonema cf. radiosum LEGE 06105]
MILIRKINPEDIEQFFLWRDADIYIQNILRREVMEHKEGKRVIFIALINSTIVGTVQLVPQHDDIELADGNSTTYLQSLLVDRNYRRQGIGYSLIQAVEFEAINRNFHRLTIMVELDNSVALKLYQKAGFSFFKNSNNMWGGIEYCVICLEKSLL